MGQELTGIRYQSKVYPTVQTIMHRVNEETLMMEHLKQNPKKATGVDGVTKSEYDRNAEENIAGLVQRMKKFSYKPQPVRRTYIPKGNGKLRPLGIPSYEDKLVQGVMAGLLAEVYEGRFRESSYGFREGRSAHDVVRIIDRAIMRGKVNYILEADIKGFFDNVNHDWLMKFLEHDIEDKNFLRYIKRFLIAGVMEGTERQESDKGTPQGGLISPVLANVYLHYVLDVWFEDRVRKSLKGEAQYVRYADDFLMMFQYEEDGKAVMEALKERLNKFSLEVAEEKTRILPFGRIKGTPNEDFDFLGFTFYNAKTRKGNYRVGMKTSKKKMTAKKKAIKEWLRKQMTQPVNVTLQALNRKLRGHYGYYGVNGNYRKLKDFSLYVFYTTYRMLTRRSQKARRLKAEKFQELWDTYVTEPHLMVNIWAG